MWEPDNGHHPWNGPRSGIGKSRRHVHPIGGKHPLCFVDPSAMSLYGSRSSLLSEPVFWTKPPHISQRRSKGRYLGRRKISSTFHGARQFIFRDRKSTRLNSSHLGI